MRAQIAVAALLLTGCVTSVQVRGRYAAAISTDDVRQIRQLVDRYRHFRRRTITLMAEQRDRVRVTTRDYSQDSWWGSTMYVIHRSSGWQVDPKQSGVGETEGVIRIY